MLSADLPVLEVYYADSCVPCRQELPVLAQVSATTRLVIYVLDKPDHLQSLKDWAVMTAPATPRTILRQAGDGDGILPYARTVKADGTPCQSWRGVLTLDRIAKMISLCGAPDRPLP